jgi:hypothetical protein
MVVMVVGAMSPDGAHNAHDPQSDERVVQSLHGRLQRERERERVSVCVRERERESLLQDFNSFSRDSNSATSFNKLNYRKKWVTVYPRT